MDWLDRAAITLSIVLAAGTLVLLAIPGYGGQIFAPGVDLALDTAAMVIAATVAALAWVTFSEHRAPVAHAEAAAFLALAIANGVAVVAAIVALQGGSSVLESGQAEAYVETAGRFMAATLLVLGGFSFLRGRHPPRPRAMLLAPAVVLVVVIVIIGLLGERLPPLIVGKPGSGSGVEQGWMTTPMGTLVQLAGAAMTAAAAVIWHRLWHKVGVVSYAYLTLALIIASFAQVNSILFPGLHTGQVSSDELLWLAFGAVLLMAIEAEARIALTRLRAANRTLETLREVEVENASLAERARLSRELHDGLAQDLWLAKLKAGRLSAIPNLEAEATLLCHELTEAIDAGLAEARQAVMALRLANDGTHAPLCELMHRFVDDFSDRYGVRSELECDHSSPPLSNRDEAEILRIAQEALSNVRRHADATLVRVLLQTRDGVFTVSVADNGKGFDPDSAGDDSYGLASMRERAALIHGRLVIESQPQDGSRVTVLVPLQAGAPGLRQAAT